MYFRESVIFPSHFSACRRTPLEIRRIIRRRFLKHFEYVPARSLDEAVTLLSQYAPDALPIAGGTDLVVRLKQNLAHPKVLVDIAGIPALKGIELQDQGLRIGALTTHYEIARSSLVRRFAPALAEASESVGVIQTRNLGTLGGNLVSCVPSNDTAPPLLVLGAQVILCGKEGQRRMPIEDFFVAPRCSAARNDEILAEIFIPAPNLGKPCGFEKFGRRKALTLALVNAAACLDFEQAKKTIITVRIALGAVAPTPIRAHKAENFLTGKQVQESVLKEASLIAAEETKPIGDFRASAQYRRTLTAVLTRRVLERALAGQGNG
jgi:carbon-monoxide dehydrogenase medium subunit